MYFQELEIEIQCWMNDVDSNLMPLARAQETLEIVSSLIAKLVAVIPNEREKRSALFNIPSHWSSTPLDQLKKSLENHIRVASIFPAVSFDALMSVGDMENDGIDLSEALAAFVARADVKTPHHVDFDWMKRSQDNVAQFLRASADMPKPKEVEEKEKKSAKEEESYDDDDFFLYSSGEEDMEDEEEDAEDEEDTSGDEAH